MILENRVDLQFLIFRRILVVVEYGLFYGLRELLESRVMVCMRLFQKFKDSQYVDIVCF